MPHPTLTAATCYAAGRDAGNKAMRAAGRTAWNETDYEAACMETIRLLRVADLIPEHDQPEKGTT